MDAERFWSRVNKAGDCWIWLGAKNPQGYGNVWVDRKTPIRAHRYAWMLKNGPIPDGMLVCHRCDNPGCVRPDHLFLGTVRDNTQDAANKGRLQQQRPGWVNNTRGERQWNAKLTEKQARWAIERRDAGADREQLARALGVSRRTINALGKENWKHLVPARVKGGAP